MKVLNLLSSGGVGGIEKLCLDIGRKAKFDNTFVFLFSEGTIYEEMKSLGLDVVSLQHFGSKKMNARRLCALVKIVKKYDIITIHHSTITIQLYYCFLRSIFPKKKFVLTAHSCYDPMIYLNYSNRIKNNIRLFILKTALNVSTEIVYVSNAGKRSYEEVFKLSNKKSVVVYNGVDVVNEHRTKKSELDKKIQITFVGRLVEGKGVQLLIKAAKELVREYHIAIYIVGDGPYRGELERLTDELNLTQFVEFVGQSRNIGEYLNCSDIFVYPSIWQEVFGISLVEAMDYGVPCVGFNVGGIPEIIDDGHNGVLVNDISEKSLQDGIQRLIEILKDDEKNEVSTNCKNTAKKYSLDNTVDGLYRTYESLLGDVL